MLTGKEEQATELQNVVYTFTVERYNPMSRFSKGEMKKTLRKDI